VTITRFLQTVSNYLAHRKGLPVLIGAGMVLLNIVVTFLPSWPVVGWLAETDLLLQLGVLIGLVGVLLGDAL